MHVKCDTGKDINA